MKRSSLRFRSADRAMALVVVAVALGGAATCESRSSPCSARQRTRFRCVRRQPTLRVATSRHTSSMRRPAPSSTSSWPTTCRARHHGAAHIHIAAVWRCLGLSSRASAIVPGADNGVVGAGSFVNPALVGAMRANPQNYYVNLHTGGAGGCPAGCHPWAARRARSEQQLALGQLYGESAGAGAIPPQRLA